MLTYYATHNNVAGIYKFSAKDLNRAHRVVEAHYKNEAGIIKVWNLPPTQRNSYVLFTIAN